MKRIVIALGIANLLVIAGACEPHSPETASVPEDPVVGDPTLYAPDGWPLEIGDTLTSEEWGDLRDQFPSVTYLGHGLRVVDGVAYKADMRSVDIIEPGADPLTALIGWRYDGHIQVDYFWLHDDHTLPTELEGVSEVHSYEDAINRGLVSRPRYTRDGRLIRHGPRSDTVPVGRIYPGYPSKTR